MRSVVKIVDLSAGNVGEIAISSTHISSLMHFIEDIYIYMYICPPRWWEVIAGIYIYIYIYTYMVGVKKKFPPSIRTTCARLKNRWRTEIER